MTALEKIGQETFDYLKSEYFKLNPKMQKVLGDVEIESVIWDKEFKILIADEQVSSDEFTKMWYMMSNKRRKSDLGKVYQGLSTFLHTLNTNL